MRLLPAILANGVLFAAALGFGALLRRLFPQNFSPIDRFAFTLLGGLGLLGTALFCIGQFWFSGTAIVVILFPGLALVAKPALRTIRNGRAMLSHFSAPLLPAAIAVSYTHLDVYKRQVTHRGFSAEVFFPGMMGYLILMLMTPAYNCFAYEGRGIQTYFTAPLRFRDVFLGKNLMHMGVLAFEIVLSITMLALRIGLPSTPVFVATIAAVFFAVTGQFVIADWVSLSFPRKLEFGSMRGQRSSGVSMWVAFGVQILVTGICSLILFAGRWTNSPWLPAEAFIGLAAASVAGYFAALDALDVYKRQQPRFATTVSWSR